MLFEGNDIFVSWIREFEKISKDFISRDLPTLTFIKIGQKPFFLIFLPNKLNSKSVTRKSAKNNSFVFLKKINKPEILEKHKI